MGMNSWSIVPESCRFLGKSTQPNKELDHFRGFRKHENDPGARAPRAVAEG
jgi:hypothetical protein